MARHHMELIYAVRPRVLAKYSGQLSLALAGLSAAPLAVSLLAGEWESSWRLALVVAVLGLYGLIMNRLPGVPAMQLNEATVLVGSAFLVAPLVMCLPLMEPGLGFWDVLFEAVSGVTTTGLTTLGRPDQRSATFLFSRAWMQWYGGLGIVIFSLAVLSHPGPEAKRLAALSPRQRDLVGGTQAWARQVLMAYAGLTLAGAAALILLGAAPFQGLLLTLAAVSTGGFSPLGDSLASLGVRLQVGVLVICLAGATPPLVYVRLFRRQTGDPLALPQVYGLLAMVLAWWALLTWLAWYHTGSLQPDQALSRLLLAASAQTTAGFSTTDPAALSPAAKLAMITAMGMGGGLGSTAGGVKILRLMILVKLAHNLVRGTALAEHAVSPLRLCGVQLAQGETRQALLIIILFAGVVLVSWLPFLILGQPPLDSLFEVMSATGTVGLSTGLTGPALPPVLKGVLCLDMLLGRLEILAWLVVVYPGTWLGRRREAE